MISRFKYFWFILSLITCIDVVYGNEIKKIEDLLDKNISLDDKIEYLSSIKNNDKYSFSRKDIGILIDVIYEYDSYFYSSEEIRDKYGVEEERTPEELQKMDIIRANILEIFLRDDINENNLTPKQCVSIVIQAFRERAYKELKDYRTRLFLALKIFIKFNTLRLHIDYDKLLAEEDRRLLIHDELRYPFEDESHEKVPDISYFEMRALQESDPWDMMEYVIFEPISGHDIYDIYINTDKKILYDYEKYLVDHIRYSPVTKQLGEGVEEAFYYTQFEDLKPTYIDAMSYLGLYVRLVRIVSSMKFDLNLRKQALEVSIALLDRIEVLYFDDFGITLLSAINECIDDPEENTEWKELLKRKIKLIEDIIAKHDRVKDLEQVIFDNYTISTEEKLWYLKNIFELDYLEFSKKSFSFSKKDYDFLKKVLDDENIDIRIRARIASIVIFKSHSIEFFEMFSTYDLEGMVFLWQTIETLSEDDIVSSLLTSDEQDTVGFIKQVIKKDKPSTDKDDVGNTAGSFLELIENSMMTPYVIEDTTVLIQQSVRFNLWDEFLKNFNKLFFSDKEKDPVVKLEAIKAGISILTKTKNLQEYGASFLEILQSISNDEQESSEVKNITDYIIQNLRVEDISEDMNLQEQERLKEVLIKILDTITLYITRLSTREKKSEIKTNTISIESISSNSNLTVDIKLELLITHYINNRQETDLIRKQAIKLSIDLLGNVKDSEKISSFFSSLKRISSNPMESKELRIISDYILLKITKEEKLPLKDLCKDCNLKFLL